MPRAIVWRVRHDGGRREILGAVTASSAEIALSLARSKWPRRRVIVESDDAVPDTTTYREWWREHGY